VIGYLWERRTRRETPFAKGGGPQGRGIYRGADAAPTSLARPAT